MESSVPWFSGAAGRRALATSVYVTLLAVLLLAYGSELRPGITDGGGAAASELLSRLLGQRVSPANALDIADRVALAACLLSAFVFATWLHILRLAPRQAVVFVLLLIGAGLRLQIALQDPVSIRRWPLDDDSHYYFNIAYNLAHGSGLKHDSFNVTTGIQPLFALLITPIYLLIESKTTAVNAVLLLQTGLGLLLAIALTTLARRVAGDLASLLALAVWAFSAYFVLIDLNGLETSLSLLFVCLACLAYQRMLGDPVPPGTRRLVGLGALLGLAFLARADNGLLGAAIAFHIGVGNRWGQPWRQRARSVGLLAACAGTLALPWVVLNIVLVGSVVPSGGQAVRFLSLAYGWRMLQASGPAFELHSIPLEYYQATMWEAMSTLRKVLARGVLPALPALALVALGFAANFRSSLAHLRKILFLWLFLLCLFLAYTTYIFGQWYFDRYLAPLALGYLLLLAIALRAVLERSSQWLSPRLWNGLQMAITLALAISLLANAVSVITPRPRRVRGFYDAAKWINRNVPESAIVGGFQTGIFGYYLERRFYGLDGKINIAALDAMREHRIDEYVRDQGIEYLADWPFVLNALLVKRSSDREFLRRQQQVYTNGEVVVYRIGPDSAGLVR
jgi:hypothetical protein